ncbi:hypothetical protein NPS01_20120 [Nocardioides psychrotolerans]|uniref:Uncharacterized protein n=1 Tax=Nocardioides psychrotolerans TaxID=1005945 RepID=A0A1I3JXE5_9ACTN|nr:hypothetical protein [Nocardioides psychrotolerans]GEP38349.1 hypothetical protein NPS01_20120 [Nocardioides psychrotolerans]SFI64939.1 hypothetical protein SAMN05216561_11164 [Nocardioides psychrotolerans]
MRCPAALDTARSLVAGRFPDARQAWLSGSVVHDSATGMPSRDGDGDPALRQECAAVLLVGPPAMTDDALTRYTLTDLVCGRRWSGFRLDAPAAALEA